VPIAIPTADGGSAPTREQHDDATHCEANKMGLLTSEGELWQRQRRLVQPLFTRRQVAGYSELIAEEAAAVAGRWDRATRNGGAVDANAEMVRLALRVGGSGETTSETRRAHR
jgi:cytochrome P450